MVNGAESLPDEVMPDRNEYYALLRRGEPLFAEIVDKLNEFHDLAFEEREEHEPSYRTAQSFREICIALALLDIETEKSERGG